MLRRALYKFTFESEGFVANLSLFSPLESKRKMILSAVATASLCPVDDQLMPVILAAPSFEMK